MHCSSSPLRPSHQGRFLKLAVAWTAARGQRLSGDPGLCGLLGRCLWNEGELDRGTRYLVLGERPYELCDLILQDVPDGKARYDIDRSSVPFLLLLLLLVFLLLPVLAVIFCCGKVPNSSAEPFICANPDAEDIKGLADSKDFRSIPKKRAPDKSETQRMRNTLVL